MSVFSLSDAQLDDTLAQIPALASRGPSRSSPAG